MRRSTGWLRPDSTRSAIGILLMSDLLWLGVLAGVFALTLAYAKLCDEA